MNRVLVVLAAIVTAGASKRRPRHRERYAG
jgi:hypothetical protein